MPFYSCLLQCVSTKNTTHIIIVPQIRKLTFLQYCYLTAVLIQILSVVPIMSFLTQTKMRSFWASIQQFGFVCYFLITQFRLFLFIRNGTEVMFSSVSASHQ